MEIWKPVPKFEGIYSASSLGRVRRDAGGAGAVAGRILTGTIHNHGYRAVGLCRDGKTFVYLVHRLVLLAFRGQPQRGQEAAHNNGARLNNKLTNLRWASRAENMQDQLQHGTFSSNGAKKLTRKNVLAIRRLLLQNKNTQMEIARRYKISPSHVSHINSGLYWKVKG
jgi:hypothetical protein